MRIAGILAAAVLLTIGGCKMPGSDARAKADVFHQRLDAGQFDTIWNESGPDIKTTTSKDEFVKLLATIHQRLGKVRETSQTGFNVHSDLKGSVAQITLQTTFERGKAEETFSYKGSGADQKLAGYHIE